VTGTSETAIASGRLGKAQGFAVRLAPLFAHFARAFEIEAALRRPFLWLPVAAGGGVVLYLSAGREPSLWLIAPAALAFGIGAYFARAHRPAFYLLCGLSALFFGELSASLRTARVAAPVLGRMHITTLDGLIEEMDFRRTGARFILRVPAAEGLAKEQTPYRVRISIRRAPPFEAGTSQSKFLPCPARFWARLFTRSVSTPSCGVTSGLAFPA